MSCIMNYMIRFSDIQSKSSCNRRHDYNIKPILLLIFINLCLLGLRVGVLTLKRSELLINFTDKVFVSFLAVFLYKHGASRYNVTKH